MFWLRKKITELQNKPYEERIRFLRRAVIGIAIFLIAFWIFSLRYRNIKPDRTGGKFGEIFENLKKLKEIAPQ